MDPEVSCRMRAARDSRSASYNPAGIGMSDSSQFFASSADATAGAWSMLL
jgi:hypothetical protein